MKSINEVDALRGVFYSFFETGRGNGVDVGVDNTSGNKILISMQTTQHQLNPFFVEDEFLCAGDEDEYNCVDTSFIYTKESNLSSMFEHLQALKKGHDFSSDHLMVIDTDSAEGARGGPADAANLDIIEEEREDTAGGGHQESSDMLLETSGGGVLVEGVRSTNPRRSSMMSSGTIFTEKVFELSSSDMGVGGGHDRPPWVDRVMLRHGMDWLDLVRLEMERDQIRNESSIIRKSNKSS